LPETSVKSYEKLKILNTFIDHTDEFFKRHVPNCALSLETLDGWGKAKDLTSFFKEIDFDSKCGIKSAYCDDTYKNDFIAMFTEKYQRKITFKEKKNIAG